MNKFIKLMSVLRRKAHLPAVVLLALMSGLAAKADVVIDETTFPDANFRNFILSQSYGTDGVLTDAEIANVKIIDFDPNEIASLQGIEVFTALTKLACNNNQLTALDLSNNQLLDTLLCQKNQLTSLNVSNNKALVYLDCRQNQLSALDVTNNTALQYLNIELNQLPTLNISKNTTLKYLNCRENLLSSLDVSSNTALEYLSLMHNQLTSIDLSNNTALEHLNFTSNQISEIDLSNNTQLESLIFQRNLLSELDLTNNTQLYKLACDDNQLTTLDLSMLPDLRELHCRRNHLTELDLSVCKGFYGPSTAGSFLTYFDQTRDLTAETGVTEQGERYYYLRLDNNVNGDKTIVERMTETNFGGVASKFDPSRVLEWTSGGTVSDGILLLTDVTEDPTTNTASGKVTYLYDINSYEDPDGNRGNFTLNWTAPIPEVPAPGPTSLELKDKAMRLQLTQSRQLEVETPDAGEITWTSSNPEVIEVDNTGRVTALKNGLAIITATAANGNSNWCAVWGNLLGDLNEDDKVDVADLNIGVSIVLGNESFTGKDFSNEKAIRLQLTQSRQLEVASPIAGEITWTSSNPEAVEVDSTGCVTALKNGLAIITATTADGISNYAVWSYLPGDLNEDDKVDVADLNTEISIVLGN